MTTLSTGSDRAPRQAATRARRGARLSGRPQLYRSYAQELALFNTTPISPCFVRM